MSTSSGTRELYSAAGAVNTCAAKTYILLFFLGELLGILQSKVTPFLLLSLCYDNHASELSIERYLSGSIDGPVDGSGGSGGAGIYEFNNQKLYRRKKQKTQKLSVKWLPG